jgi:hypothetical protein
MSIKINANCLVSAMDNVMVLNTWAHNIYLTISAIKYEFRHKQDNILFKLDGELASISEFESQLANIKFYRNDYNLVIEFLDSYQECLRQLIMIFDSVHISCLYDVNILNNNINIDNIDQYIKCLGCDVDYADVVISDSFAIPESKRKVHMYCDIVFSTCNPDEDYDAAYSKEYLEINCSSSSIIVSGICNSDKYRLIIKNLCLDLQNFDHIKNNGMLDDLLSQSEFYFNNDYDNCIMTDVNILQHYAILLRDYYPKLKFTTLKVGCNVNQTISVNRNLIGKSAANSADKLS